MGRVHRKSDREGTNQAVWEKCGIALGGLHPNDKVWMTLTLGSHTITVGTENYFTTPYDYASFLISHNEYPYPPYQGDFVDVGASDSANTTDTIFFGKSIGYEIQLQNLSGGALPDFSVIPFEEIEFDNFPIHTFQLDGDAGTLTSFEFMPETVPEPASIILSMVGLVLVGLATKRRYKLT
jgi:hypothetical protein